MLYAVLLFCFRFKCCFSFIDRVLHPYPWKLYTHGNKLSFFYWIVELEILLTYLVSCAYVFICRYLSRVVFCAAVNHAASVHFIAQVIVVTLTLLRQFTIRCYLICFTLFYNVPVSFAITLGQREARYFDFCVMLSISFHWPHHSSLFDLVLWMPILTFRLRDVFLNWNS